MADIFQNHNHNHRRLSNRRTDLTTMSGDWQRPSKNYQRDRGWYPNELCQRLTPVKEIVIQIRRSDPTKDWSLSAKALHDVNNAEREGLIVQGYVRLIDHDGSYVAHETVQNVIRMIGHVSPKEGEFGAYWWITSKFRVNEGGNPIDSHFLI